MDIFNFRDEMALRLFLSFLVGAAIGMEREYRSKAAGLRTMIVICLGSTIFTEISIRIGAGSPDRIASNIVTGVGFLGAGVIFKDGLSINGITTATTIWIAAALGMAVGAGEYGIAIAGSLIALVVLTLFEKVKIFISRRHQSRSYRIAYYDDGSFRPALHDMLKQLKLDFELERESKDETVVVITYGINGREEKLNALNDHLRQDTRVKSYDY
ncbi:MgtC/SapB family protein [Parachryseolinea silvisoli]|jgi:putative Mg2+ transporter-C (MgtC) family protein|uniref:MgtC/SapB family protein n=1 Tax=Parachryseolinea silvisoli TaxID=2873601 RepID=UPI002265BFC9|nr:MgtC/SapB family protein [Parachryseolinea silvisoli]MCD9014990.1 MgtC/SapB family protein [Parachryseolinea silvisoli]